MSDIIKRYRTTAAIESCKRSGLLRIAINSEDLIIKELGKCTRKLTALQITPERSGGHNKKFL